MPTNKQSTTYRLTDECRAMIRKMSDWHGVADVAVIEAAVRVMYRMGPPTATQEAVAQAMAEVKEDRPVPTENRRGRPRTAPPDPPPPVEPPPKRPRGRPKKGGAT